MAPPLSAPANVDTYIATFAPEVQAILQNVRKAVRRAAPAATEVISYRMPALRQNGVLVYFAAFRNHIGFYPPIRGDRELEKAAAPYAGEKGNLRFPLDEPIPYDLIERLTRHRMQQDLAGAGTKRSTAGYSGTPLARKLGFKPSSRVLLLDAPGDYLPLLGSLPEGVVFEENAGPRTDIVHVFVTRKEDLARRLRALRQTLRADATVWVSWPKKASGVPSTVTEDIIRQVALPLGLVDVKVCAVSEVWSGLKLVVRRDLR
jgi:uncharacterized protein YdhG (YjbR/CyaY superfamily)